MQTLRQFEVTVHKAQIYAHGTQYDRLHEIGWVVMSARLNGDAEEKMLKLKYRQLLKLAERMDATGVTSHNAAWRWLNDWGRK